MPNDLERIDRHLDILSSRIDHVVQMAERQNEMLQKREACFEELEENSKLTMILLAGNELNESDKGLVGSINELRKEFSSYKESNHLRLVNLEKFKDRMMWFAGGITTTIGFLIAAVSYFLNHYKK